MKNYTSVLTLILCLFAAINNQTQAQTKTQTKTTDMEKIETLIQSIVEAADSRHTAILQKHLHPEFRVVANRFGGDDAKVLTKETYLGMLKEGKIGGDKRIVDIKSVDVQNHIAVAKATLTGAKVTFTSFYQFVKDPKGEWQLIGDMPLLISKD